MNNSLYYGASLIIGIKSVAFRFFNINEQGLNQATAEDLLKRFGKNEFAMAIRSDWQSLFKQEIFSNMQLMLAVVLTFGLQMTVIYVTFLQDIFNTQALTLFELLLCIGL